MTPRTLHELFVQTTAAHAGEVGFRFKQGRGWHDVTWAEHRASVDRVSRGLLALGVARGDRVAILSTTRLEWVQADAATVNIGATTVGIYPAEVAEECAFILEHSEAGVLFVENRAQLDKILAVRDRLPRLRWLVLLEGAGAGEGSIDWQELQRRGGAVPDADRERAARAIDPDDVASLVYTSGTTGRPKGVMITHQNLLAATRAGDRALVFESHYCTLLFLPLAHVFARLLVYLCLVRGLTTAFAEDLGHVPDNLREIRPHFIAGVPRLYEKIHERVHAAAERGGWLRHRLFEWAVAVGHRVEVRRRERGSVSAPLALQHAVADRLVLRKVRAVFGGRLVWAASGAAPLDRSLCEFFLACGVRLVEGLGMTENTSLSNANRLDRIKPGTVGPVVEGVEMKIAPDGEVLFRGANVMRGYYKDPQATAEAIDPEGWLHSGDIGEIDEEGYLRITDRKKDLIITAGGKNIAPQYIERVLRTSRYIGHAVAYGDRRKYLTALVTLDPENIREWAARNGRDGATPEALAHDPAVHELIRSEIDERNRQLASYETVKQFRILPADLTVEGGELTPTSKIRRKVVCQKYASLLDDMYRD